MNQVAFLCVCAQDGNGKLDVDELATFLHAVAGNNDVNTKALFAEIDEVPACLLHLDISCNPFCVDSVGR